MRNIEKVVLENFKGMSGSYELEELTAISGGNESGKTTISDAIQFALLGYVPGDFVNRTNPDQYDAYCSHDKGTMAVEVHSNGKAFRVEYSRAKKAVSRKCTLNGVDLPSDAMGASLLEVKVIDLKKYWGKSKPNEQVETLFRFVDVDPDEIKALNVKIGMANESKKNAQKRKLEEARALEDHVLELQGLNEVAVGFNPETAEAELKEINAKVDRINSSIMETIGTKAKRESLTEQIEHLKQLTLTKGEEVASINIPTASETIIDVEKDLEALESAKAQLESIDKAKARIATLEAKRQPTPSACKRQDIEAERMKLIEAQQSGGGPTQRDRIGYEIGKGLFELMRDTDVIHEEERRLCLQLVRDVCSDFKKAMEGPIMDTTKVQEIQRNITSMENTLAQYDLAHNDYIMSQKEASDLKQELNSTKVPTFDANHYQKLLQTKAMAGAKSQEIESAKARQAQLSTDMADAFSKIADKEKALSLLPADQDLDGLQRDLENLQALIPPLRDGVKAQAQYDAIKNLADRKEVAVDEWTREVSKWKDIEAKHQKEKADLLETVQEALADKADRILAPSRMTFELPKTTKGTDRIRFLWHQPDGTVVDRATVSGAQEIEFDIALAHALVGDQGVVIADEVNNLDDVSLTKLFSRMKEAQERGTMPQTILVGHSLAKFSPNEVMVLDMGKGRHK